MAARKFQSTIQPTLDRISKLESALIKKGAVSKDEIDLEKPIKPKRAKLNAR